MIVSLYHKLAIVTPPKCGSTSLHFRLCEQGPGMYVIGPQCDGNYEKHTTLLPWMVKANDCQVILIVRNPFTRAHSLWLHYRKFGGQWDFQTWVERILITGENAFNWTISYMTRELEYDHYVKLEYIQDTFKQRWDIDLSLPRLNQLHDDSPIQWTNRIVDLIQVWGHWDFEKFNYPREAP